jgi:hypothetical protein
MYRLAAVTALLGALSTAVHAQDNAAQALPAIGTDGGTSFTRQCGAGQVLTGVRARVGLIIDALGVKCRSVNANGTLGTEFNVGALAGGTGGIETSGSCPAGSVVSGQAGAKAVPVGIAYFDLRCRRWESATRRFTGSVVAVIHVISGVGAARIVVDAVPHVGLPPSDCSRQEQPVVLLRGRAGAVVDAAALTCNEP